MVWEGKESVGPRQGMELEVKEGDGKESWESIALPFLKF